MSNKNQGGGKKNVSEGYVPLEKGHKPSGGIVTGGHKPEKSKIKPVNPPKKKQQLYNNSIEAVCLHAGAFRQPLMLSV